MDKIEIESVIKILEEHYGDMSCALNFNSPFELLVATMLSAQTTDITVNKATAVLFSKYNTPEQLSSVPLEELEGYVKTCGFYRNKAKNIIATSKILFEKYGSKVPETMEELTALPGVGRKTANVVLSNAFNKDAIAVDTHVFRVSNRLGLANSKTPEDTEMQLMENLPKEYWSRMHHWIIWHGRYVCSARKPNCEECQIKEFCKHYNEENEN